LSISQVRTMTDTNQKEIRRFLKFATVGAAGSVTDFAILNILIQVFGFPLAVANLFSFTAAVIQNFILNRIWTFPESQGRDARSQLVQFTIVSLVGLAINQAVFLGVNNLLLPYWSEWIANPELAYAVSYNFAKLFAIGVVLFWNFFVNRLWTYRGL
jgi:putative flippase GtrA